MTVTVTGGVTSTDGAYTVRTFETSGTLTVAGGTLTDVEFLLIGGGGRVAVPTSSYVAGGGAGGVRTGNITINPGSYTVLVGNATYGSEFFGFIVDPGGTGGFYGNGFPGGSGGGGGTLGTVHIGFQNFVGGKGIKGQGHDGGAPFGGGYPPFGPGGGGGATGPGGQGQIDGTGGAGGLGITSAITGSTITYAAGGAGKGPGGCGTPADGYDKYGAGGGFGPGSEFLNPQPGVLILRYLT
jgi:hypothetical protein